MKELRKQKHSQELRKYLRWEEPLQQHLTAFSCLLMLQISLPKMSVGLSL